MYRPTPITIGHCHSLTRDTGRSPPADMYTYTYTPPDACLSHPEPGALLKAAAAAAELRAQGGIRSGMRDVYSER